MKTIISYAQNREDIIIHAFFQDVKKGFYIDVGAYHPIIDSVTKYFYEMGWSGVNVEPQGEFVELLKKDRKRDTVLQLGIADKKGSLELSAYEGGGFSTFDETTKKERASEKIKTKKLIKVAVMTLSDLWAEHTIPKNPEFLKIDVEGFEFEVIKGNDWQRNRPKLLCIEANHVHNKWRDYILAQDYVFAFFDGLNEYFLAKEEIKRLDQFKVEYPKQFLSRQNVVSFDQYNENAYYKTEYDKNLNEVGILKKELVKAYDKVAELEKQKNILLKDKEEYRLAAEKLKAEIDKSLAVIIRGRVVKLKKRKK